MPFSPEELLARAIVLTRRVAGIRMRLMNPSITIGEIEIDIFNRIVTDGGIGRAPVRDRAGPALPAGQSRGPGGWTRKEILHGIWGIDGVGASNIVDRHIRSLRIKLRDDYRHPRFIATVPGKGYVNPTFSTTGWNGEADRVRTI